ncbi:MAG: hydroxymethylbilane synthase [Thermoplasmata archaeon]
MILGARGSKLSLIQANIVSELLKNMGIIVETKAIKTLGDVNLKPISNIDERGIFSKELNRHVIEGNIDIAVHSMKDLDTELENDLEISAILERGAVEDVLVSKWDIDSFPEHYIIGTSSIRRKMFLKHYRPEIEIVDIRGNVDTRIRKYKENEVDGIIVAKAGLDRLGAQVQYTVLDKRIFVPQANQGAIAVIARKDSEASKILKKLDHLETRISCMTEREVLSILKAGCHVPIGIYSWILDSQINLQVSEVSEDSKSRKDLFLKKHVSEQKELIREFKKRW